MVGDNLDFKTRKGVQGTQGPPRWWMVENASTGEQKQLVCKNTVRKREIQENGKKRIQNVNLSTLSTFYSTKMNNKYR